jgi:superfamily I DNA/RNA helicase
VWTAFFGTSGEKTQPGSLVRFTEESTREIKLLFRRLDLPYKKYSEGSWNRHHNEIKQIVEVYKQDGTGLDNETFRNLVLDLITSKSLALLTLRLSLDLRQQLQEKEIEKKKQKKA